MILLFIIGLLLLDELICLFPVVETKLELLLVHVALAEVGTVLGKPLNVTVLDLLLNKLLGALHELLSL